MKWWEKFGKRRFGCFHFWIEPDEHQADMRIPSIDVGGQYQHVTHVTHDIGLPSQTPFGNMLLKWGKIIDRLIRLNRLIPTAYRLHHAMFSEAPPSFPSPWSELSHLLEEIAYWLRKTADELISLSFLCHSQHCGLVMPRRIEVDCIGQLIDGRSPHLTSLYAAHLKHLQLLNEVSLLSKTSSHLGGGLDFTRGGVF